MDFETFKSLEQSCKVIELGKIYFPSGRICCCDPFLSHEIAPFETTIIPGFYGVELFIVNTVDWGNRIALAVLKFENQIPSNWLRATYPIDNQLLSTFRVDSGLACFMDFETAKMFRCIIDQFYKKSPRGNYYDDILAEEFLKNADPDNSRHIGDWNLHCPAQNSQYNIAMFASGLGDGLYSSYWGMSQNEHLIALAIDFQVL